MPTTRACSTFPAARSGESSEDVCLVAVVLEAKCKSRCKMPNVDPATGVRHRVEPDRSLRKYRDVDQGAPKYGCLGMQLCPIFHDANEPTTHESVLEVGAELSVLQRGSHVYIPQ